MNKVFHQPPRTGQTVRHRAGLHPWLFRLLIVGALLVLLGAYPGGRVALAHGKEIRVQVSSFTPDPQRPLAPLYRVRVVYAGDGEPVTGARVRLAAARKGGGPPMEPVLLQPLNEAGLYAAQVTYPIYGSWEVTVLVEELLGSGDTSFVEEVLPAGPAAETREVRQRVLDLFFGFNWWDVGAIAVRVAHTLAAAAWFGLTAVILVAFKLLPPPSRAPFFRRLSPIFPPAAALSLLVLAASGLYTAVFSAPVKPPGVLDFDVMWRIPFGPHYLGAMAFKVVALGASGVVAVAMARALRAASLPVPAGGSGLAAGRELGGVGEAATVAQASPLLRWAVANGVLGLLLAVDIVLSIYLHYISHLAAFLPE